MKNPLNAALAKKVAGAVMPKTTLALRAGKALGTAAMGAKKAYSKSWKDWTNSAEHKAKVQKLKDSGY